MLKRNLFSKIFVLITSLCIIVSTFILVITIGERTKAIEESLIQQNKLLAKVASRNIESGYYAHILPLETLRLISDSEDILFLWVIKPSGEIYLANKPEMLGKIIQDPDLSTDKVVVKDSVWPEGGEKIKLIIQPIEIREGREKPWTLFVGVSLKAVSSAQKTIIFNSFGFLIAVIIITAFISFYLARGLTKPLGYLREGVEIIGKGNLEHRIKVKTGDEMEELAESFNQMAEDLKKYHASLEESKTVLEIKVATRTKELKELAESLDEQVKKRTKELQEKIDELERFHRLSVGRELKMIGLKKEIVKLKKELEKNKGRQ